VTRNRQGSTGHAVPTDTGDAERTGKGGSSCDGRDVAGGRRCGWRDRGLRPATLAIRAALRRGYHATCFPRLADHPTGPLPETSAATLRALAEVVVESPGMARTTVPGRGRVGGIKVYFLSLPPAVAAENRLTFRSGSDVTMR